MLLHIWPSHYYKTFSNSIKFSYIVPNEPKAKMNLRKSFDFGYQTHFFAKTSRINISIHIPFDSNFDGVF